MNSKTIYNNLCESRKLKSNQYCKGSNLHKHHIIPKHSGGDDIDENFTYLTVREHIIAHYLLWRIYKNPNDLRSMKMLGAKLTSHQRKQTGLFCFENKIGFFSDKFAKQDMFEWRKKGIKTQVENQMGIHDPKHKSKYCSMGGKIGGSIQRDNKLGMFGISKEEHLKNCRKGALALTGRKTMHHPNQKGYIRVKPEDIEEKMKQGYVLGMGKRSNFK